MDLTTLLDIAFGLAIGWIWGRYKGRRPFVRALGRLWGELMFDVVDAHGKSKIEDRPDLVIRKNVIGAIAKLSDVSSDQLSISAKSAVNISNDELLLAMKWLLGQDVSDISVALPQALRALLDKPKF